MKFLVTAAFALIPLHAFAVLPYGIKDDEIPALPPVCVAMMTGNGKATFKDQFGAQAFGSMHHYCAGVNFVNRARKYPKDRGFYFVNAKDEYQYVARAIEKNHWFRPQLHFELAQVLIQMRERAEAQALLVQALTVNAGYEPAYIALAALQWDAQMRDMALQTAGEGLRHIPNSKALQKAYLDYGGKMPFPEPVAQSPSPIPTAPENEAKESTEVKEGRDKKTASESRADAQNPISDRGCRYCPPDQIQQRWHESFQTGK